MQDRVPLYPGRVKLTPVSGQENTYDMVRADEPTQEGTPLSKATFLKDDTAALFGLDATAVPDDALSAIKILLDNAQTAANNAQAIANSKANIATGSYIGTRYSGASYPNSLTFNFKPKILFINGTNGSTSYGKALFFLQGLSTSYCDRAYWWMAFNESILKFDNAYAKVVNNRVYWYSTASLYAQMNNDEEYHYVAIG